MNCSYILNEISGIKRPIIEHYLMCETDIKYLINECIHVVKWEQNLENTDYDYDFLISFVNSDDVFRHIFHLERDIKASIPVNITLLDKEIENILLNEAEAEVYINFYINIKTK